MKLAAILLVILALLAATTAPAAAEPITIAIASTIGIELIAGTTAAAVATFALTTAVSIGLSLAANALLRKPDDQAADTSSSGADLSVQYGAAVARSAIMGPGAVGGHHIYTNVYGSTNENMECVFVIGDGKHGKLTRLKYNGKDCTLPAGGLGINTYYPVPEFTLTTPFGTFYGVTLRYFDGRFDQEADADLIAKSNPPGRWTADHRGRGVAYLVVTQVYAEGDLGLTGVPQLLIETEGLMLYDPRKDSTNGGSGPHRWGQINTYEPSSNPAVQEYNYRRGVLVDGKRVLGMSMSPVNLILQMYFAAMNINDEPIPLAAGGTEPRYRCSISVSDDRAASDVLSALRAATAGYSLERGGQFGPIPGVPQVPIASLAFTDDDMIVGVPASFTKYRSRSELVTATFGQFADPAQFWTPTAFPPRENAADDAALGERIAKSLDLTQVYSSSQAQRIAESERRRVLQQGQGTATLPAKWIGVQPGDWLPFNSARHGNMTVLVTGVNLDTASQRVAITYEKISNSVYSWTTAGELFPPDVGDPGTTGTLIMIAAGMTAVGVNLPGDGSLYTPGIQFSWVPILDPTVEQIDFEIRQLGDAHILPFTAEFPAAGSAVCSGHGIAAATHYEYRHRLYTNPDRNAPWSDWASVVSGNLHIVPQSLTSIPGDVQLASFEAGLRDYVANQLQTGFERTARFEQLIASTAAEQEAANWLDLQISKRTDVNIKGQVDAISGGKVWRGPYSPSADYFPNDMVQMPDGSLWWTPEKVKGIAPPAAPWVEEITASVLQEQWIAFAGPDGATAQTSDSIETRFGSGTLVRSVAQIINDWVAFAGPDFSAAQTSLSIETRFGADAGDPALPLSLAQLTSHWQAFAGPDFAAAQTSDQIQAKFNSVDVTTGDLNTGLATITSQWHAFAGPDGSAAQTSDQITVAFNTLNTTTGNTSAALATLSSQWDAFAGPDHAVAQSEATTLAQIGGNTSSINVLTQATANINGKLDATWQVVADTGGNISALKLYSASSPSGPPTSSFDVVADKFRVSFPGQATKTVFQVGNYNGAAQLVMRGDMILDGSIIARSLTTGELITLTAQIRDGIIASAKIGDLQVGTLKIANGAVTQCGIAGNGAGITPGVVYTEVLRASVTVFGTGGSEIVLVVSGGFDQINVNDVPGTQAIEDWYVELIENGQQFDSGSNWSNAATRVTVSGGMKIIASAGGNGLNARIMAKRQSIGASSSTLANRRLTLTAYVK